MNSTSPARAKRKDADLMYVKAGIFQAFIAFMQGFAYPEREYIRRAVLLEKEGTLPASKDVCACQSRCTVCASRHSSSIE
jgi:hypothetical protein